MGKIYGSMKNRSASPIYRKHLSESVREYFKTHKVWNKGKKTGALSIEHKQKISDSEKGKKKNYSADGLKRKLKAMKKRWRDTKYRKKMTEAVSKANRSRVISKEQRERLSIIFSDKGNPRYIDGRTKKWKEIRTKCFQRDEYTCQECGDKSSKGNRVYLQSHHIVHRKKCKDIYNINNLITLCRNCHCKMTDIENTDKYLVYLKKFQEYIKMKGGEK